MRIVSGTFAGKKLVSPSGRVRPTAEELRDLWLTQLAKDLLGASVLELFAGSGALGLEALSRGAKTCDFVENSPAALHALKANVAALGVRKNARIFKRDAIPFVERIDQIGYDVALVDAPYGSGKLDRVLTRWLTVPFAAILSIEHAVDHVLPVTGKQTRRVGDSVVTILRVSRRQRRGP